MKTIKIDETDWKELKQLALDNSSTIGKEIKRLLKLDTIKEVKDGI